jgi:ABC-type uncharacterized transport system substrate-binding protein
MTGHPGTASAMSDVGTFETCRLTLRMSANRGEDRKGAAHSQSAAIDPTATSAVPFECASLSRYNAMGSGEAMRRREFLGLVGGAAASWPLAARGQRASAIKRVAILMGLAETDAEGQARNKAFRQRLQKLGWIENTNIEFEYYWNVNSNKRGDELAAEVMNKRVDVIFTNSPAALAAAKQATRSIPIVFVQFTDPVEDGFVASVAHPGGNITGFASSEHVMSTKWLDLLRELAPRTTRVGFIQNVEHPSWLRYNRIIQEVAPSFGFAAVPIGVSGASEIEEGINKLSLLLFRGALS